LNLGEQQFYEIADKIPLSIDYQRTLLEGITVSPEIQKIEIEKPRLSTMEDKELQKKSLREDS